VTAISREQLILLADTALRRPIEHDTLTDGLTTTWTTDDHLRQRIADLEVRVSSLEGTVLSQRTEILNAQRASTR
jgi:hypothetical protein